jgi:glycosyltransferase involved in cell wall biosynthesis
MNCSLIICTYNWHEALKLVLESVQNQSIFPDEIIIADDGSGQEIANTVQEFKDKISIPIVHSWQEDIGCRIPHSRNKAIAKSSYEYIIMIDGDTILHPDFIKDHKKNAKKNLYIQGSRVLLQPPITKKILENGIFSPPSFLSDDAKNKLNMIRNPIFAWLVSLIKSQNLNRVRGCNFSVFRDKILSVNGFNEEITLWGREDSEFVQRLFNIGLRKQQLKFSGIQYHLHHKERTHSKVNDALLEKTIKNKISKCEIGISQYL